MTRNLSANILDYFAKRRNQIITITELMKELGFTKTQIQGNITHLQKRNGVNLKTTVAGQAWMLIDGPVNTPQERTGKNLFEEIGPSKAGFIVIQDTQGKLYKAEEL